MHHTNNTGALRRYVLKLVDSKVHSPQVLTKSPEQFSLNGVRDTRRYRKHLIYVDGENGAKKIKNEDKEE